MVETWIHHYAPESREGSKQWVKPGENAYCAALLVRLVDKIRNKRLHLKKKKIFFLLWQWTISHIEHCNRQIKKSLLHPSFSPDHYLFPKFKRWLCDRRWVERTSWMGNRRVFWWVCQIVLFGRHRKVRRSLDLLYQTKRRVHWEIKPIFTKKKNSCSFYHVNIKHPSMCRQEWKG